MIEAGQQVSFVLKALEARRIILQTCSEHLNRYGTTHQLMLCLVSRVLFAYSGKGMNSIAPVQHSIDLQYASIRIHNRYPEVMNRPDSTFYPASTLVNRRAIRTAVHPLTASAGLPDEPLIPLTRAYL